MVINGKDKIYVVLDDQHKQVQVVDKKLFDAFQAVNSLGLVLTSFERSRVVKAVLATHGHDYGAGTLLTAQAAYKAFTEGVKKSAPETFDGKKVLTLTRLEDGLKRKAVYNLPSTFAKHREGEVFKDCDSYSFLKKTGSVYEYDTYADADYVLREYKQEGVQ